MLYINLESTPTQPALRLVWHFGGLSPCSHEDIRLIEYIQADGDELDCITTWFKDSIPNSHQRVQAWYGDIAKSIAFRLGLPK